MNVSPREVFEVRGKKKKKQKTARSRKGFWPAGWTAIVAVILAFTLAAVLHVRAKLVVVQLGYQLSEATKENKRFMTALRKLKLEVATLRNPRRLRRLATEKLGLVEPSPGQILNGSEDRGRVAASSLPGAGESY